MAPKSVEAVLRDLKTRIGGIAVALVPRNGLVPSADLPEGVFLETSSVIYATILGAATTANSQFDRAKPERIVIEGPDSNSIPAESGENALPVVVVDTSSGAQRTMCGTTNFGDLLEGRAGRGG